MVVVRNRTIFLGICLSVAPIALFLLNVSSVTKVRDIGIKTVCPEATHRLFNLIMNDVLRCEKRGFVLDSEKIIMSAEHALTHGADPYKATFEVQPASIHGEQYVKILKGKKLSIHELVKEARKSFEGWCKDLNRRYSQNTLEQVESKVRKGQSVDVEALAAQGLAWYERALVKKKTMENFVMAIPVIRSFAKLFGRLDQRLELHKA